MEIPIFLFKKIIMEKTTNLRKTINPTWKEFLKKYTSQQDVAKVSLDHDMGYHTLHGIKNRTLKISNEKNKCALESLMIIAQKNAIAKTKEIEKDIKTMFSLKNWSDVIESD